MSASAFFAKKRPEEEEAVVNVPLDESAYRLLKIMAEQWSEGCPPENETTPREMLDHVVRSYYQDYHMNGGGC